MINVIYDNENYRETDVRKTGLIKYHKTRIKIPLKYVGHLWPKDKG